MLLVGAGVEEALEVVFVVAVLVAVGTGEVWLVQRLQLPQLFIRYHSSSSSSLLVLSFLSFHSCFFYSYSLAHSLTLSRAGWVHFSFQSFFSFTLSYVFFFPLFSFLSFLVSFAALTDEVKQGEEDDDLM